MKAPKLKKKNYRLCCLISNKKLGRLSKLSKSGDIEKLEKALKKLK